MRNWLQRVMAGRYGVDEYSRFLNIVALVSLVLSILFNNGLSVFFWLLAIISLVWTYFRMFSRNTYKRRAENNAYLTIRYSMTRKLSGLKQRMQQKRYYRFYKCPKCGITTRVPKGKGKIRITCPKCGEIFQRKS
ncbi:MAG: zinc ribbon domain-containing protein [Clostridiaceae bacterium]|nr:zinc ribbon domain-containing protein [Clostridia bacterium]MDD7312429.1 zinc ribbon domain-containing protein [Clostridia bacterium]MDY3871137.1 zinc ribbon domain-containing protein [Clostridiaceae bacterium]